MKGRNPLVSLANSTALAIALSCSTAVFAQTPQQASPPPSEGDAGGLQDIVVTAQKRAQNVQDVPIAVSALLGSQLEKSGVVGTDSLRTVFSGVNIKITSSNFMPSIRGIGTSNGNVENAAALYIDGVYYANQSDAKRDLVDIDQIAVLKGPQGTLFGRNATAGVIQITTRQPSHTWRTEISTSIDNYATARGSVYMTGGITPELAFSASANVAGQGKGWGKNYFTGKDTYKIHHIVAFRGKLLYQPSSSTDITLTGDYSDRSDNLGAYFRPFPGTGVSPLVPFTPVRTVYDSNTNDEAINLYKGGGLSLKIDQELSFAKLTSISAWRKFHTGYRIDTDMTPAVGYTLDNRRNFGESFSQEAQLTSLTGSKINWAVGLYYFHYTNAIRPVRRIYGTALFVPAPTSYVEQDISSKETAESVAPFAQADFEILPRTRVTIGGRWTYEKRTLDGTLYGTQANGTFVPQIIPTINGASVTAKKPSWRIALDHKFSDDIMGYISYNRGIKSGGFNISNLRNPPYLPERLDAYEAGLKTELFNKKVRLNISGFFYKYNNLQVLVTLNGLSAITNGAKAELYGLDADFEVQLAKGLRLSGGLEALHTEFTDYRNAVISRPTPGGGVTLSVGDVTGNRLPLAQRFVGNLALDYTTDVSFGGLAFNATLNHNGQYYFETDNFVQQKSYEMVNLSANWTSRNKVLTVGAFLRNALDKKIIAYSAAFSGLGYITSYDNAPRTYGLTAKVVF